MMIHKEGKLLKDTSKLDNQTWMPVTAGVLSITSGTMGLITLTFLITFGATFGADIARDVLKSVGFWQSGIPLTIIGLISIPLIVINAIAILGGIYAIQRKNWGLALAGTICAIIPAQVLGIVATIFTILSKKEFD